MTDAVLLDTNILSYSMRGDTVFRQYRKHLLGKTHFISFVTVGELRYGAELAGWGTSRRGLLEQTLEKFAVIEYDSEVAFFYARLRATRERAGHPIGFGDAWIAACALRHGLPLVTHNARDFAGIDGLAVVSEATA